MQWTICCYSSKVPFSGDELMRVGLTSSEDTNKNSIYKMNKRQLCRIPSSKIYI